MVGFGNMSSVYYRWEVLFLETLVSVEAIRFRPPQGNCGCSLHKGCLAPLRPVSGALLGLEGRPSTPTHFELYFDPFKNFLSLLLTVCDI